ncbi:hypothetical protein ACFQXB_14850 [Plastorhodobacter daqingensis]|uniref:Tripartite-type tricarboxylate transporter, receptor component TctC n=1 Tax=Plastorhodobacter daqingensis TaxID=1387281 RepID=A0ABW2UQH5_9RHOB
MSRINVLRGLAGGCAIAIWVATGAAAQPIDLTGQTVTIVHNAAPGGATGLGAQIAANAWAKTMAGAPTIVVQSVEGGALSRGILQVMNARPDGRTIGWLAWNGSTRILDPEPLQIPFANFGLIGGVGGATFLVHVSVDAENGPRDADDVVNLDHLRFGGYNPKSAPSMRTAAALDMLGVDYTFISGFSGDNPLEAALQRGEIDAYPATSVFYNQQLRDGPIAAGKSFSLFYFTGPNEAGDALLEDPFLPGEETFDAYFRRVTGSEPSGPEWEMIKYHGRVTDPINWLIVAPPGTPEDHLQMLRTSFAEATQDPEFLAEAERIFGRVPTISHFEQVEAIVEEIANTPPEMRDLMSSYIAKMER